MPGTFDWAANADKFPGVAKPNPSYHGVVFTEAAGPAAYITKARATLLRDQGATLSPFNAWLLLLGLETLSLRVDRHVENALKVVEFLNNHPQVASVNHPALATGRAKELYDEYYPNGAGSIFTFDVKGTADDARKFTESLSLVQPAGERCRREVAGHPSGIHHALPADRGRAAGRRHQAHHRAPVHRHREHRRHHRRPGRRLRSHQVARQRPNAHGGTTLPAPISPARSGSPARRQPSKRYGASVSPTERAIARDRGQLREMP